MRAHLDTNVSHRTAIALACIPPVDCVVNQLANGFQLHVGSVSVLQAFRAALLLCFTVAVFTKVYREPGCIRRIPFAAIGALLLILMLLSKEWFVAESVATETFIAYGQMAYWVVLWILASITCTAASQAMLLLYGLACGAILTALSVFLGLALGSTNYYEEDFVLASSGWFNTAKMITGMLVCGIAVILYLGCGRHRPWIHGLLAALCLAGAFVTYARAGTVAFVLVVLWFLLWTAHARGFVQWRALQWFLGAFFVLTLATPLLFSSQALFSRWSDLAEGDRAGSGRAAIWSIAAEGFGRAPLSAQLLGSGYDSMSDFLYREYGDDVKHTHNDALDMLMVGGVVGLVWLVGFIWAWCAQIVSFSPWSLEGAAAVAVFVDYLCHAQLTGQLWGTDVMTYYALAMTAFTVIGRSHRSSIQVRRVVPITSPMAA